MHWTWSACRVAAWGVVALVAGVLSVRLVAAPPATRLSVRLVSVATLPADARTALTGEAERLWHRAGLQIEWADAGGEPGATPALRVLVLSSHAARAHHDESWPVGEFLRDARPGPLAMTSLAAAVRVLDAAGLPPEPTATRHQRLGRILGRAVAHEIGHHLLGAAHGKRGLMRARIDVTDFADLRDGHFELDRADAVRAIAAATATPVRLALANPAR